MISFAISNEKIFTSLPIISTRLIKELDMYFTGQSKGSDSVDLNTIG